MNMQDICLRSLFICCLATLLCGGTTELRTPSSVCANTSKEQPKLPELNTSQEVALIEVKSSSHLREIFDRRDFSIQNIKCDDSYCVPRIYMNNFPVDLKKVSLAEKKDLFIQVLLPMILRVNEEILAERKHLKTIYEKHNRGMRVTQQEKAWLNSLSEKYKLNEVNFQELLRRVDIIPVSMALAQSVVESGWGVSFASIRKNSPYGMTPKNNVVKTYDNLMESTFHYIRNLNTNNAYRAMRNAREKMRKNGDDLDAHKLMDKLHAYSVQRATYIRKVRGAMRANNLHEFDSVQLTNSSFSLKSDV